MKRTILIFGVALVIVVGLGYWGWTQFSYLAARYELNKGVEFFTGANYALAAQHFEKSMRLDPELVDAQTYRAYCYMMQYIPGGESEDNVKVAQVALEGFEDVLERDPDNEAAMSSTASLYFNMKEFDKAKEWYMRVTEKFPQNKEAFYTLGVLDWTETYQPRLEVRANLGMRPEDPGPIKDQKARVELAETSLPLIEEGLMMLEKALDIDPDYDDAMAYVNLLYRERADLSESKEEYDKFNSIADEWVQRTLDTKKRKAEASTVEAFQEQ